MLLRNKISENQKAFGQHNELSKKRILSVQRATNNKKEHLRNRGRSNYYNRKGMKRRKPESRKDVNAESIYLNTEINGLIDSPRIEPNFASDSNPGTGNFYYCCKFRLMTF